jgi:O-antigen/teichoic acid export membrane protein
MSTTVTGELARDVAGRGGQETARGLLSAGPTSLVASLRAHLAQPLFRSAYSLMLSTLATSLLGLAFWAVAAHEFTAATVGRDGALVASVMTLSGICMLNLNHALIRFLPRLGRRTSAHRVLQAYGLSVVAAVAIATAFVLGAPRISGAYGYLRNPWLAGGYVLAVAGWGVFNLQDAALTSLRRATWVPIENTLFSLLKLAALPLLALLGVTHGIFAAWMLPLVLIIPIVNFGLFRRVIPAHRPAVASEHDDDYDAHRLRLSGRTLVRLMAQDYLGSVMAQAALTTLPVLVVSTLGTRENAYFYIAFTLICCFDLLVYYLTVSLTAEAARDERQLRALVHTIVGRLGVPLLLACGALALAAPLLLAPFGGAYVHNGSAVLRVLAFASVFRACLYLFGAVCLIQGRGGWILGSRAASLVLLLPLAVVLGNRFGLEGIGWAWLASNAIVALAILPFLLRFLRPQSAPAGLS